MHFYSECVIIDDIYESDGKPIFANNLEEFIICVSLENLQFFFLNFIFLNIYLLYFVIAIRHFMLSIYPYLERNARVSSDYYINR